jgi:hypothetical protein
MSCADEVFGNCSVASAGRLTDAGHVLRVGAAAAVGEHGVQGGHQVRPAAFPAAGR